MIVTPTSLTYHWLAEFKRFDESLRVRVIAGHREDRLRAIAELKRADDVDVILTSYPLLRPGYRRCKGNSPAVCGFGRGAKREKRAKPGRRGR